MQSNLSVLVTKAEKLVEDAHEDERIKRSALASLRRTIEMARLQGDDVSDAQKDLERLESKFRADVSDNALREAASYASKRAALLSSKDSQHRQDVLGRADLLAQSRDANESLTRTRNLMVKEISRMNEISSVLVADSEKLRDVGGEYNQYGSSIKVARDMLKNMQRREYTDRMLLGFGLLFFLLVVAYILKRRLLPFFSPIGWLIEQIAYYASSNGTESLPQESAASGLKGGEL